MPWTTRQMTSLLIFSFFNFPQSSLDWKRHEEEEEEEEPGGNRKGEDMNLIGGDFKRLLFD